MSTTWDDVLAARRRLAPHLPRTPLRGYPALDEAVGLQVLVKHENHLPTASPRARSYDLTRGPLQQLAGFVAVSDAQTADAIRRLDALTLRRVATGEL